MKIAWLCKQKYMNHDVIHDQYGRLYNLPKELTRLNHEVTAFCLNYSSTSKLNNFIPLPNNEIQLLKWHSYQAGFFGLNLPNYMRTLASTINKNKPDILIGGSDCLHSILTWWVAKQTKTPYVLDLYDNFESFGMSRIPGMKSGHRKAIKNAAGITTISDALKFHVQSFAPNVPVMTINSTIKTGDFTDQSIDEARSSLGLPANAILIGTAGSLSANRGTDMLYKVLDRVQQNHPQAMLAFAGAAHGNPPPIRKDIIYLGVLPHHQINTFFNALDVAVICMKDDPFGRYAFPQKAYEILSCKVPVLAADVGALKELFADFPQCLYSPDSTKDLELKILNQITNRIIPDITAPGWDDQAKKIEKFIVKLLPAAKRGYLF